MADEAPRTFDPWLDDRRILAGGERLRGGDRAERGEAIGMLVHPACLGLVVTHGERWSRAVRLHPDRLGFRLLDAGERVALCEDESGVDHDPHQQTDARGAPMLVPSDDSGCYVRWPEVAADGLDKVPIDLAAIRARLGAASPGPWRRDETDGRAIRSINDNLIAIVVRGGFDARFDSELIAHAPGDIAALLGEIERLREQATRRVRHAGGSHRSASGGVVAKSGGPKR